MSSRLNTKDTLDMNPAVFRYWQGLNRTIYKMIYQRSAIGHWLCEGRVKEAFGPGFDIMQGDNIHPRNDEILNDKELTDYMDITIKAIAASIAYGYSVQIFGKFAESTKPVYYWLEEPDISELSILEGTKIIKSIQFTPPVKYAYNYKPIRVVGAQAANTRIIGDFTATMGEFRSYLEPIADILVSLINLNQQAALLIIRVGSGVRIIKVPYTLLEDETTKNEIYNGLRNMGVNSLFVVPDSIEGEVDIQVYFGEGGQVDFTSHRDNYLKEIAAYTGYPKEAFDGAEIGLRSAETNRQGYLNRQVELQQKHATAVLFMLEKVYELDTENVWLRWKPFTEPDETETLDNNIKRIEALKSLLNIVDHSKIDQVFDFLGLELPADIIDLEVYKQQQANLLSATGDPVNNDTDKEKNTKGAGADTPDPEEEGED